MQFLHAFLQFQCQMRPWLAVNELGTGFRISNIQTSVSSEKVAYILCVLFFLHRLIYLHTYHPLFFFYSISHRFVGFGLDHHIFFMRRPATTSMGRIEAEPHHIHSCQPKFSHALQTAYMAKVIKSHDAWVFFLLSSKLSCHI